MVIAILAALIATHAGAAYVGYKRGAAVAAELARVKIAVKSA